MRLSRQKPRWLVERRPRDGQMARVRCSVERISSTMTASWQYWKDGLDGKPVVAIQDDPQYGFFRQSHKAHYGARKTFTPVAFWPGQNGDVRCRLGDTDVSQERCIALWNSVNRN